MTIFLISFSYAESDDGFCDSEINTTVVHGVYNWSEIAVGNKDHILCYYGNENAPNSTANVSRKCEAHRTWAEYDSGECITLTTFRFQQLSQVC